MLSQWESFLKNIGTWVGSFTQFSTTGELIEDRPSSLTLAGLNNNQSVQLTLKRQGLDDLVLNIDSLSHSLLFFENGAFCQGSIQFAPISQFGAEFGFIHENRRLRLVQLFDGDNQLRKLTLIREYRQGSEFNQHPPLTIDALQGKWQGEAVTLYPDFRKPSVFSTNLELKIDASGKVIQTSSFADNPSLTSTATINGSVLTFDGNRENPIQVLMLPDGASATFPTQAKLNQTLFLEAGWLIQSNLRQRMIRTYNPKGEWTGLTLVTERKV